MKKPEDLTGKYFNRWHVIEFAYTKNYKRYWKCQCECGTVKYLPTCTLNDSTSKSCGCYMKEVISNVNKTHGLSCSRLNRIWREIKRRCYNPNFKNYCNWGGRGISMCEQWKNNFQSFYDWSMANGYDDTLSIDRINNDGNYEPTNCRWATSLTQNNNSRNCNYIEFNNEIHTVTEWCRILSLPVTAIKNRLYKGWSVEKAFTTPIKSNLKSN